MQYTPFTDSERIVVVVNLDRKKNFHLEKDVIRFAVHIETVSPPLNEGKIKSEEYKQRRSLLPLAFLV